MPDALCSQPGTDRRSYAITLSGSRSGVTNATIANKCGATPSVMYGPLRRAPLLAETRRVHRTSDPMTCQSTKTIRADEARRVFGVEGEGIVLALLDSGVHRHHVHFVAHKNLTLPPPLRHMDFSAPELEEGLREQEALVDLVGTGTHCAGIICGESSNEADGHIGIAPKCKILSVKLFDQMGMGSEKNIVTALDWLKSINRDGRKPLIHGLVANFGMSSDVTAYPCGLSPVCEAINDLVRSGLVAVVPAGNGGYIETDDKVSRLKLSLFGSISDPGNAELAITVGSTHRTFPHDYGASYFSSRGPTIDGRLKPDLLAPGEKISSCWIERQSSAPKKDRRKHVKSAPASYSRIDGTSSAAAHVAGAVALLLSARPEFVGRPLEVKRLLIETATDLGRVPWAQGRGLIDVVRLITKAQEPLQAATSTPLPGLERRAGETSRGAAGQPPILPESLRPPSAVAEGGKRFVIALSYPGTHRELAKQVVYALRQLTRLPREQILFDLFHEAELSRFDLDVYLPKLYADESELVVVFLGGDYEHSQWCGLEWRAIRQLIKERHGSQIMPMRLDQSEVPGVYSTDGFMDIRNRDPEEIAARIVERLELNRGRGASGR